MKKVFVTGATGFVGRHLLPRLAYFDEVVCLARGPKTDSAGLPANVRWIPGDLNDPATFSEALHGMDAVVHLAALTGKARAREYDRVNIEGTRSLLEAARRADVPCFLHVSSVAVKFPDKSGYPYGRSKQEGETLVRASGLQHTIVRPAIILGSGSPVWKGVAPMLELPMMPVFGDGHTPIQPIHVADVAEFLVEILRRRLFRGETLEFGGPEVLTFEELLQRAREKRSGRRVRAVHIPLKPVIALLTLLEPLLFPVLPITVGQLSSFRFSGVMDPNPMWEERRTRLRLVLEMLE